MDEPELNQICPEDTLKVLLQAKQIPHGSVVTKQRGGCDYTLSHRFRMFAPDVGTMMDINGYFLVRRQDAAADVNQILADQLLLWVVGAEEFKDYLERIWEPTPQ